MLFFTYVYSDDVLAHALDQPDTPLAKEILDNLAKFPHCILLTRVGQFYEVCTVFSFMLLYRSPYPLITSRTSPRPLK